MENKGFKRKLITTNDKQADRIIARARECAEQVNDTLADVEKLLSERLENNEKKQLLAKGYSCLLERVRQSFQFPNADDEFNFNALGTDTRPLETQLQTAISLYKREDLELSSKGTVILSQEAEKRIREKTSYFTQNEKQNAALAKSKDICNVLNERLGIIMDMAAFQHPHHALNAAAEAWGFLEVEKVNDQYMFVPSLRKIMTF